jgi:flavorubredoxin
MLIPLPRDRGWTGHTCPIGGELSPSPTPTREIVPGIHWIQECGPDRFDLADSTPGLDGSWYRAGAPLHLPQNAYLLRGEKTLLFDTLSPAAAPWVVAAVDEVLAGAPLDYLVVSHPDVPHAGNTMRILRAHPEATLVAPRFGETHALYHLDGALKVGPDDALDLGGIEARFHEATFLDHSMHMWMSEAATGTLFTVDWLGFPHMEGECLRFAHEVDTPVSVARLVEFHGRVMFWFQYVDVARMKEAIDRVWETFRPAIVASGHGLPVLRDTHDYFDHMKEVVRYVRENGRTGVA